MSNKEEPGGQPSLSQGSQECFETECEPCGESGNLVKAEGYCVTCKEFLCQNCIMCHKSMKMSRRHKIQGPDEMPKTKPSDEEDNVDLATQDEPSSLCKSHKKEIIKYFCKDHKTVCCVDCVTLSHRSCHNILLVNEVCNDDTTSTELKHFLQRLNGVADGFRNLLEMAENNRMKIEEQREKLLQDVRIYKESIIEAINKLVQVIETTVQEKIKVDKVKTEELAKCCNTIQNSIEAMSTEFESLQNSEQKSEEFILMNQSENQLDEWERNKQEMATNTYLSHVDFSPSLKLRKTFREIKEIGLLVEESDAEQCEACKTVTLKTNMQSLSCGHSCCDVCIPDATENKRTCPMCGSVTVNCSRCKNTVDQSSISDLACRHEVCLTCTNQMIANMSPCVDCGMITVSCSRCKTAVDQSSMSALACRHEVCLTCTNQMIANKSPCTDCGMITVNCTRCKTAVDQSSMSALACGHEVCLTCTNQMIANKSPCTDCGKITVKCKRCQASVDQYNISSLACGHEVCLSCRKQQTENEAPCTDCGLITGNQPEGSFSVEEDFLCLDIRVTFPDGKQKSHHPRPGEAYKGQTLIWNLFKNETGKEICQMLRAAFDRKLVCRIEQDKVTPNIELYTGNVYCWPGFSITEEYRAYISRVTERLKKLGITK